MIDIYKEDYRPYLKDLTKNDRTFNMPTPNYLKDLALCVWDIKRHEMVAFVCIVAGLSDTVYGSHFVLDKKLRKTVQGGHIINKISQYLDESLKRMNKRACEFFVHEDNKDIIKLYSKRGCENLGRGYMFRREIT